MKTSRNPNNLYGLDGLPVDLHRVTAPSAAPIRSWAWLPATTRDQLRHAVEQALGVFDVARAWSSSPGVGEALHRMRRIIGLWGVGHKPPPPAPAAAPTTATAPRRPPGI